MIKYTILQLSDRCWSVTIEKDERHTRYLGLCSSIDMALKRVNKDWLAISPTEQEQPLNLGPFVEVQPKNPWTPPNEKQAGARLRKLSKKEKKS